MTPQGEHAQEQERSTEEGGTLTVLTLHQVALVDRALAALGDFGEVRLVKHKGKLRYIVRVESKDLLTDV
jgi:hypothetical protein